MLKRTGNRPFFYILFKIYCLLFLYLWYTYYDGLVVGIIIFNKGDKVMSVKKCMGKTVAALEKGKTGMVKLYDFVRSLYIKNKACFDIQLRSDKSCFPICRHGFSYNKEIRVMPIIWCMIGIVTIFSVMKSLFRKN